jgi:PPK2 family polyphosphate:nucleotide phosphotransferase
VAKKDARTRSKSGKPDPPAEQAAPTEETKPAKPAPPRKTDEPIRIGDLLRLPAGAVDLSSVDPRSTPGAGGHRAVTDADFARTAPRLAQLQERLYAEGVGGGNRRVVLLLQGMDTSGKDGTTKHVVGQVNPQGVAITTFKVPTSAERRHDFLWRIRRAVPRGGSLGIFNRSQYEDVLVVRVHNLVPESEWQTRYDRINAFEREIADDGVHLIKVFLHISKDEQKQRLLERLDDPTKHWKYNPKDVDERGFWDDYQAAYLDALVRCSTEVAPGGAGGPGPAVPARRLRRDGRA